MHVDTYFRRYAAENIEKTPFEKPANKPTPVLSLAVVSTYNLSIHPFLYRHSRI
jgi:hypothetical protein